MLTATPAAAFPARTTRPFYQLTIVGKVLVMVAGPLTNVALAFVCFLGVNLLYGVHETVPTGRAVVASVAGCVIPDGARRLACASTDPVSPAKAAGLQVGDQIVRFNSHEITSWAQLTALVHANGHRRFVMEVARPDPQDPAAQDLGGGHHPSDRAERTLRASTVLVAKKDGADAGNGAAQGAEPMVGFLGVSPESTTTVTRHGPVYTLRQMSTMVTQTASALVGLPGHVANVALAVAGLAERNPDGPMSILGGSRLAGEIAATEVPGFDAASKAALLVMVLGSFNLFIGVVNLVPLLPLDGGHVVGALWEQLRRRIAQLLRRPDPGYVDTSRWVVVTYSVGLALVVMGFVLVVGDLFVPISSGL